MSDIIKTAYDRIPEPLSRGENVKKLLELHVSAYSDQVKAAADIEGNKDLDLAGADLLEWFGVLKGLRRPKESVDKTFYDQFFNMFTPDRMGFSDLDLSKPMYFNQQNYFTVGDDAFKVIIETFCKLTGFRGTVGEYELFFREIFGVGVQIRQSGYDLVFIMYETEGVSILNADMASVTPVLPQTKNTFYNSPKTLFSLGFSNIGGTDLDFGSEITSSLYFPI